MSSDKFASVCIKIHAHFVRVEGEYQEGDAQDCARAVQTLFQTLIDLRPEWRVALEVEGGFDVADMEDVPVEVTSTVAPVPDFLMPYPEEATTINSMESFLSRLEELMLMAEEEEEE